MVQMPKKTLEGLKRSLAPYPKAWEIDGICAICGGRAEEFRDALSIKEYGISRMCQRCQDEIFGGVE